MKEACFGWNQIVLKANGFSQFGSGDADGEREKSS